MPEKIIINHLFIGLIASMFTGNFVLLTQAKRHWQKLHTGLINSR
jgi:hypothetical protein